MYTFDKRPDMLEVDLMAFSSGIDTTSIRDALLFTGYGYLQDTNTESIKKIQVCI